MRTLIALLLLTGCDQLFQINRLPDVHDAAPSDALRDSAIDAARDARPDAALACAATGIACTTQATTFVCGSTCFVSCRTHVMWATAESRCINGGAQLAVLDTQLTDLCVAAHLPENSWIGLVQSSSQTAPNALWAWTGPMVTPLSYTDWRLNEPNDNDGTENDEEDCAFSTTSTNGSGWVDYSCASTLAFVCQR